jgi:hypothetical protein
MAQDHHVLDARPRTAYSMADEVP